MLFRFSSGEPEGDRETVTAGLLDPAPERRGLDIATDLEFCCEVLVREISFEIHRAWLRMIQFGKGR